MRQSGARMQREYIEGVPRKRPSRQGRPDREEADRTNHIDLRVRSMVEIDTNPNFDAWNELLIDIGRRNHAKGTARSLGSIAITYIPSKHLNMMIKERYSREYHDPQKKLKLFRRINEGMNEYLQAASRTSYEKRFEEVVTARELRLEQQALVAGGLGHVVGMEEFDWSEEYDDETHFLPEDGLRVIEHPFAAVTMQVRKIDTYAGGAKFGLDLSLNDEINEVRSGLIGHLAGKRMDVSVLRRDWDAHATIFDVHDHMRGVTLDWQADVPADLKFDAPATEMIVAPRS